MTAISTSSTSSTSSKSSSSANYSRISGLASGLDIDSIVSKMMMAERIPLDKLEQQKQTLEWQQADYRTLNTTLYDFKTNAFDTRLERTFLARTAASSNETAATATAGANAADGTYNIKVNLLATGVSKASTAALASAKDTNGNNLTLYNQFKTDFDARSVLETSNITVNINGTDLQFDLDSDTINTVVSKINEANLGVKASYDSSMNRFFLNSNSTGSDAKIAIASDTAGFISNLGIDDNTSILKLSINQGVGVSYTGQNASIDFGDATGLVSASNSITINGITLNMKATGSSTITVTRDKDAVVASVTKFVDAYNKTLKTLYDKVQEERNKDYSPLTDAQKKEMSDSEITKWEEKAKSGLLRTDERLKSIINSFRSTVSGMVGGIGGGYNSLSSIGIKSEAYDKTGKLIIDKDALREALTKDPDAVKDLFTKTSTADNEQGIAAKLYKTTVDGISYLADKASSDSSTSTVDSSYIGKKLTKLGTEIKDWEKKLKKKEDKNYAKFTTMEQAIYKMNAQSSWLTSMLGSSS